MEDLPYEILVDFFENVRYEDIPHLCRTNSMYANICRSDQGQAHIRKLQQDFLERRVDNLLDQLPQQYLFLDLIWPHIPQKSRSEYINRLKNVFDDSHERQVNKQFLLENYHLMSNLERDLPNVLVSIQ